MQAYKFLYISNMACNVKAILGLKCEQPSDPL